MQRVQSDAVRAALFAPCLATLLLGFSGAAQGESFEATWRTEATLRDVTFVDADTGWAVGDGGTIWHTQNGGEKWVLQTSPVRCRLTGVSFLDRDHGFAVGGHVVPHTRATRGVVLVTTDGGRKWNQMPGLLLPWVTGVHFHTKTQGIAHGFASPLFPTGVWRTRDGGRTWTPLASGATHHWRAGAWSGSSGWLVSELGDAALVKGDRVLPTPTLRPHPLWVGRAAASLEGGVALVGGAPRLSVDSGASWVSLDVAGPGGRLDGFAVSAAQHHVWMAGSPGTRIYHSADYAQHFTPVATEGTLPLHALHFVGPDGWAVGAGGRIVRTENGGESWRVQRGGGQRAALLAIVPHVDDVPWELLAKLSREGAFRIQLLVLAQPQRSAPLDVPLDARLASAAGELGIGARALTQFHVDAALELPASTLLRQWQHGDTDVLAELAELLTQEIRIWRPDVVLLPQRAGQGGKGLERFLKRLVMDAIAFASSEQSFPNQLEQQGLQPWTVQRALGVKAAGSAAALARSAHDVRDAAARARRFLGQHAAASGWSLVALQAEEETPMGTDPFAGLNVPYASASRRARPHVAQHGGPLADAERRRAHVQGLLESGGSLVGSGSHRAEQALQLLATLEVEVAGELLFDMALDRARQGDHVASDHALRQLVSRYDQHALFDAALLWLMAYHTSAEEAHRGTRARVDQTIQLASLEEEVAAANGPVLEQGGQASRQSPSDLARRLGELCKSKRPTLYADPRFAFGLAAALRDGGASSAARGLYRQAMALPKTSPWRHRASQELAHLEKGGTAADLTCGVLRERPRLDGDLTDATWQDATFLDLGGQDGTESWATVAIARDAEHLYIAAQCRKVDGATYLPARRPRPRDSELKQMDRLILRLDINRDYRSYYELEVDHRGWTRERVRDDLSWNPRYFVASAATDNDWSVELAIPLGELAAEVMGSTWALGVAREIPHHRRDIWQPGERSTPSLQGLLHLP